MGRGGSEWERTKSHRALSSITSEDDFHSYSPDSAPNYDTLTSQTRSPAVAHPPKKPAG